MNIDQTQLGTTHTYQGTFEEALQAMIASSDNAARPEGLVKKKVIYYHHAHRKVLGHKILSLLAATLHGQEEGAEIRTLINCSACYSMIAKHATLMYRDRNGTWRTVLWDTLPDENHPLHEFFYKVNEMVLGNDNKPNTGLPMILSPGVTVLGTPSNYSEKHDKDFNHFHMTIPEHYAGYGEVALRNRLHRAIQALRADVLLEAINPTTLRAAYAAFSSDGELNFANRQSNYIEYLLKLYFEPNDTVRHFADIQDDVVKAFLEGNEYRGVKNSALGEFLKMTHDKDPAAKAKYNAMTNADVYARPVTAPTENAVEVAEKAVVALGYADSLQRRPLKANELDDLAIWTPTEAQEEAIDQEPTSVFAHLKKDAKKEEKAHQVKKNMTYDEFARTLSSYDRITVPASRSTVWGFYNTQHNADAKCIYDIGMTVHTVLSQAIRTTAELDVVAVAHNPAFVDYQGGEYDNILFVLDNKKEVGYVSAMDGMSIFPELLKTELYPHRRVFEHYSKNTPLDDEMRRSDTPFAEGIVLFRAHFNNKLPGSSFVVHGHRKDAVLGDVVDIITIF